MRFNQYLRVLASSMVFWSTNVFPSTMGFESCYHNQYVMVFVSWYWYLMVFVSE